MSRRDSTVRFVQVDGWWVPVEQPAPAPRYDAYHMMGATFAGFLAGLLTLASMVLR